MKGGIFLSKNVFDILLNPTKRKKSNKEDSRIKSLISDNLKKEPETDDVFSQLEEIGEERDKEDYLEDIERLSMRELDKKSQKEQLRILKLSYNRLFERADNLSKELNKRDRSLRDMNMEVENLSERISGFRDAYRDLIMYIPGYPELKNMVNQGDWRRENVAPLLEKAITELNQRHSNADKIISENEEGYLKLLKEKDEEIEGYKEIVGDLLVLEEQIENLLSGKEETPTKENDPTISDKVDEMNYKKSPEGKLDLSLKDDESNKKDTKDEEPINEVQKNKKKKTPYKPHFNETLNKKTESEDKSSDKKETHKNKQPNITKDEKVNESNHQKTKSKKEELLKKHRDRKKQINNAGSKPPSPIKQDDDAREQHDHPLSPNYKEVEKQKVSEIFDENINVYLNNLSNKQEYLIKIIGETGISRNTDLRDYLNDDKKGFDLFKKHNKIDYQSLSSEVASLRGTQILEDIKLSLGGRGGGASQVVFELSNVGKQCYKLLYEDDPVIPEKKRVVDMHGSLEHGYMIKDSAFILEEMGYTVYTKNEDITFQVSNGRRKVFDIVAKDKDDKVIHIEVERGTHNKEDFFDAMDRIFEITNEFYFICPNDTILNGTTKKHFFEWIKENLGGVKNADLILHTTTMASLRRKPKNIWTTTDLRNFKKK